MNLINENFVDQTIFKHPFTCLIAGPTQSGKTTLLKKILEFNKSLIDIPPNRIVYCYARWQEAYDKLKILLPSIEFKQGIFDIDEFDHSSHNLVILDDLMDECEKDKTILNLFTTDSHQKNISVFLISQNLFSQGKYARTISLNCHYLILLNNPRDRGQIFYLARQMYPSMPNYLIECYEDAVENKQFGYLFIDLKQTTNKKFRVQTGVLPNEQRIIYQIK